MAISIKFNEKTNLEHILSDFSLFSHNAPMKPRNVQRYEVSIKGETAKFYEHVITGCDREPYRRPKLRTMKCLVGKGILDYNIPKILLPQDKLSQELLARCLIGHIRNRNIYHEVEGSLKMIRL